MKRIWQYSTSLLFSALVAHQAFGQGYGPRSWKHYLPQSPASSVTADQDVAPKMEPTPAKPPAEAKEASKVAATVDEASQNTPAAYNKASFSNASYYDQADQDDPNGVPAPAPGLLNEAPPAPAAPSASDAYALDNPAACIAYDPCCDCCCDSGVARNFARIEYLMWWGRGRALPPLVTTSFNGTPVLDVGILGLGSTTVEYGGNDVGTDWRSGGRLTVGRVLDDAGEWVAVGRFLGLDDSSDEYHATSAAGDPILARPFFNSQLNQPDALIVAYPGVAENASIDVSSRSDLLAAEVYVRHLILGEEDMTIDILGGYQMSRIDDNLEIRNSSLIINDPKGIFAPLTTINMRDQFGTRNEFHGGVVGLAIDTFRGPWKFEALGKVGFGNQRQTVSIAGNTVLTPQVGPVVNDPNGLLARQTNSGVYQRDVFTFIPELNLTIGYQVNNWTFTVGYTFIYWNDVAFAGSQIDQTVNLSNPIVGDARPTFVFRDTDFWLQGISFGAELAF
jgi:hypothetical protein